MTPDRSSQDTSERPVLVVGTIAFVGKALNNLMSAHTFACALPW